MSWALPEWLDYFGDYASDVEHLFTALGIVLVLSIVRALLRGIRDYLKSLQILRTNPLTAISKYF